MIEEKAKEIKMKSFFKTKKLLFAPWAAENKFYLATQQWYSPLETIFGEIISFDPQKNRRLYGRKKMNEMFLEVIRKEQPDYIFLWLIYDEFLPETLFKIREVCPRSKIISSNYDDDSQFYNFFRFYAPFFDYNIIGEKDFIPIYKKDGMNNVFCSMGVSSETFKPLQLEKIYDVVFVGTPKGNRYEFVKYLHQNKINIRVFGHGWEAYPDLKEIYLGPLESEDFVKVLNQTKIALCFTRNYWNQPHFIPKVFEIGSTKTFGLIEYFEGYYDVFDKEEIVMFRTKEEMLEKVKYYLKNQKEREKVSEKAYRKIVSKYSSEVEFNYIFKEIFKERNKKDIRTFPDPNKRVIYLDPKELNKTQDQLRSSLENIDYICFLKKGDSISRSKDKIQSYSLEKSKKSISLCDYYLNSSLLGDYAGVNINLVFKQPKDRINSLLFLQQMMVEKKYFLENLEKFREFYRSRKFNMLEKDIVFVAIPLISLREKIKKYNQVKGLVSSIFLENIKRDALNGSLLWSKQLYGALLSPFFTGNLFILKMFITNVIKGDYLKKLGKIDNYRV